MSRARIALALGLTLLLGGCGKMFGFRRGWSIEAPPPQYASGPTQTGHTTQTLLDPTVAHTLCQQQGTFSADQKGYGVACYVPSLDMVVLPKDWPSQSEFQQMRVHEWAHPRGWRHNDDGTGTGPASLPPKAWTDPSFHPDDPANPAPVYVGPPAPVMTAANIPQRPMTQPVPPGLMGSSARAQ